MSAFVFGDWSTAQKIARSIRVPDLEIQSVGDERMLLTHLAKSNAPTLVMVLVSSRAQRSSLEAVRKIRALKNSRLIHVYLAGSLSAPLLTAAYRAGVDGDLVAPLGQDLMQARFGAWWRLAQQRQQSTGAGSAANAAGGDPITRLVANPAWSGASTNLAAAATQFLGVPCSVRPFEGRPDLAFAVGITLANVEAEAEVRLSIGANNASACQLAVHLFGPETEDLAADMLGELGNIFMGTVKRTFDENGVPFTGGLPQPIEAEEVVAPPNPYPHQEAFVLSVLDASLVVRIGLRKKGNLMVTVGQLKEGMVLAKDVYNARGVLLMKGKTRLSRTMIERMRKLMPKKLKMEVQDVGDLAAA